MCAERSTPRSIYLSAFEERAEPGLNVCLISVSALHLQCKVDDCCTCRSRNGWNTTSCASRTQSAVRGTLSSCSTIPHLPRIECIHVTISRSLKDIGCLSHTYIGMCGGAKVCRSVTSLPTVITRQTFGFSWPTAAQRTHISATCEFGSVPPTRQSAWKAWCSSNTWLQSLGRYRRLSHWRAAHAHNRASRHYCKLQSQIAAWVALGEAIL